jgi:hypothetical protein
VTYKNSRQIITSLQITSARQLLGWTPAGLARRAGIPALTAYRIEDAECLARARRGTLLSVREAFEAAGIIISDEGVHLNKTDLPKSDQVCA